MNNRFKLTLATILAITSLNAISTIPDLRVLRTKTETVQTDLELILKQANMIDKISFRVESSPEDSVFIKCSEQQVNLVVKGNQRWRETFYMGLQRLGFLFPHPRMQISPTIGEVRRHCGKNYKWKPLVKYHGFHLHTLHPSEWVHGFLIGKTQIANDTVRWMARNQQNILDLTLLDMPVEKMVQNLKEPFALAKDFGIHTGIVAGLAFHQQNSYKLISLWGSLFDSLSMDQLNKNLSFLLENIDMSFVNLESGTSEFTPANYDRSLDWMNQAARLAKEKDIAVLIKIHTSSNQKNEKHGNFNFLPSHSSKDVGILPHTVFMYGINDESAPMYGNKNFHAIRDFMVTERDKRRTWYYPETSYFCGLDIDVPLLLTDYLLTRANDTAFIRANNIEGQLNFSTGHEVGYWLLDWTYALLNNSDYDLDPYVGIRLLGEDVNSWKRIVEYQNKYFNHKRVVSILNFSTLGDELLPGLHQTLKRNLLKDLSSDKEKLSQEINVLEEAIQELPNDETIKNSELAAMWEITKARLHHALANRMAMSNEDRKETHLATAIKMRKHAQKNVDMIHQQHNRYPEASIFEKHDNPTAYKWGYAYPVKELYYWKREEESIRQNNFNFYFKPIFSFLEVIDGWVL